MRQRLKEPSTHAGIAAIFLGLNELLEIGLTGSGAVETASNAATAVVAGSTGDWATALAALGAGLAAIFAPEAKSATGTRT